MGRVFLFVSGAGVVVLGVIIVLAILALTGHFEPSHAGPAS
jgi:hypothetical protein